MASSVVKFLNKQDRIEARLFVGDKKTDRSRITALPQLPFERKLNYIIEHLVSLHGLAATSSFAFQRIIQKYDPDVIHLHRLQGHYFNLLNLLGIPDDLPVVWTLHDMWPVTGGCAYSYDCDRYQDQCGSCPQLKASPSLAVDTTPILLRLKEAILDRVPVTAVSPSEWLQSHARRSRMPFHTVEHIPNGIDIDRFTPSNSDHIREQLGIAKSDFVVLFLAHHPDDTRKGIHKLIDAFERVSARDDVTALIVGDGEVNPSLFPDWLRVTTTGFVSEEMLPKIYATADIFVVPSLADNFPLTPLEAMAAGTPVIGFPVGGIVEQLTEDTGYLCSETTPAAMARAIEHVLDHPDELASKSNLARERAVAEFDVQQCVSRYRSLYERII